MKKYLKFMFLAVIALAFTSCEKDGLDVNGEDDPSVVNGKLLLVLS